MTVDTPSGEARNMPKASGAAAAGVAVGSTKGAPAAEPAAVVRPAERPMAVRPAAPKAASPEAPTPEPRFEPKPGVAPKPATRAESEPAAPPARSTAEAAPETAKAAVRPVTEPAPVAAPKKPMRGARRSPKKAGEAAPKAPREAPSGAARAAVSRPPAVLGDTGGLAAVERSTAAMARACSVFGAGWAQLVTQTLAHQAEAWRALADCRSFDDTIRVQSAFLHDLVNDLVEGSVRLTQTSCEAAAEIAAPLGEQAVATVRQLGGGRAA